MKVLDLFSGIGGFSLGLERTGGFTTAAFCEQAEYPCRVLAKHWPGVPIYPDIRGLTANILALDGLYPDVICGGFPCQDLSVAGRGAGLSGDRSGLWFEMLRLIEEVQPDYVIAENVVALRSRGLEVVLGGLASIGYDAEWHCLPASAIGAPHRRDRVWIVACPDGRGWRVEGYVGQASGGTGAGQSGDGGASLADAGGAGLPRAEQPGWRQPIVTSADLRRTIAQRYWRRSEPGMVRDSNGLPARLHRYPVEVEPWEGDTPRTVGRGMPDRRGRIMGLGNSIIPHIAQMIGEAILWDRYSTG